MITLIDNYDSFTYNLYHCLSKRDQVLVIKNDLILKNIKPTRSFKDEDEDEGKSSSALGSLGLKPKPAV